MEHCEISIHLSTWSSKTFRSQALSLSLVLSLLKGMEVSCQCKRLLIHFMDEMKKMMKNVAGWESNGKLCHRLLFKQMWFCQFPDSESLRSIPVPIANWPTSCAKIIKIYHPHSFVYFKTKVLFFQLQNSDLKSCIFRGKKKNIS